MLTIAQFRQVRPETSADRSIMLFTQAKGARAITEGDRDWRQVLLCQVDRMRLGMSRVEQEEPTLALEFHRFMAEFSSQRLLNTTQCISRLLE
jgi:hypothetical protein